MKSKQCIGCENLEPHPEPRRFGWCKLKNMDIKRIKKCPRIHGMRKKAIKETKLRTDEDG